MNTATSAAMADLDSILDSTLDDLADIPEFKPFPAGAHKCIINWEFKEIAKQMCPELKLTAIETMELSNPGTVNADGSIAGDQPVKQGDTCAQAFVFKKKDGTKNEISEGQFKNIMKALSTALGTSVNREIIEQSQGMEVVAVTAVRTDDSDKDNVKHYLQIKNVLPV